MSNQENVAPGTDLPTDTTAHTPPIFLQWQGKHPEWLPRQKDTPCAVCKQALWHRAAVRNDKSEKTEPVTRAFCRVMHTLTFVAAQPEVGPDDDFVMSCDGPFLRDDKES